jgi:hypothetical protein
MTKDQFFAFTCRAVDEASDVVPIAIYDALEVIADKYEEIIEGMKEDLATGEEVNQK